MEVRIKSNRDEIEKLLEQRVPIALEACGLKAEAYAKKLCPVDTGLLRNSITHAVSGQGAAAATYRATYGSGRNKKGQRLSASAKNAGGVGFGSYIGTFGTGDEKLVYIGTNVEYAPYIEMGTQRTDAHPFIKPAIENHQNMYRRIIEHYLSNGGSV